jgi:predicted phosphodiesterase
VIYSDAHSQYRFLFQLLNYLLQFANRCHIIANGDNCEFTLLPIKEVEERAKEWVILMNAFEKTIIPGNHDPGDLIQKITGWEFGKEIHGAIEIEIGKRMVTVTHGWQYDPITQSLPWRFFAWLPFIKSPTPSRRRDKKQWDKYTKQVYGTYANVSRTKKSHVIGHTHYAQLAWNEGNIYRFDSGDIRDNETYLIIIKEEVFLCKGWRVLSSIKVY